MTYFSDAILVWLLALGFIGIALALRILVLMRGPGVIEASQLIKKSTVVKLKKDCEIINESFDLANNISKPLEGFLVDLRTEKDSEIWKQNDQIDDREGKVNGLRDDNTQQEPLQGKLEEFTTSREQLEANFHKIIAKKEEEISRLKGKVVELESLSGQFKKCESSMTDIENQWRQRTDSFKKQVESLQARIRELGTNNPLAEERLMYLIDLTEKFQSLREEKQVKISPLKHDIFHHKSFQEFWWWKIDGNGKKTICFIKT